MALPLELCGLENHGILMEGKGLPESARIGSVADRGMPLFCLK